MEKHIDKDCIFCKLANGEIPTTSIYEDEDFNVIMDLGPASRGHSIILPEAAGQTVFHLHVHLIPRYKDDQVNITWKPGEPEEDMGAIAEQIKKGFE